MNKLKRLFALALAAALMATPLGGCGSSDTGTDQPPAGESQPASQDAAPAESETAEPAGAGADTIRFAHLYDPGAGEAAKQSYDWIQAGAARFNEQYPDIKVELEYYKWDELDTKMMADFQSGITHDVVFSTSMQFPEHYKFGDLLDIKPYVDQWAPEEVADFSWHPDWETASHEGGLYGIPTGLHARGILYRKDLFEAAGLDPEQPPKTLDELVEYAKKLTTGDVYGLGMYLGTERANNELYFCPYIWNNGGDIWDPATKEASFASDAGVQAMQFLVDLVYTHKVTPEFAISGTYSDVRDGFLNGQYAMMEGFGSYWIADVEGAGMLDNVGLFAVPEGSSRFANCYMLSVAGSTENPELSMKLLEAMLAPDILPMYAEAGLPARQSAYSAPEYQSEFYTQWQNIAADGRGMALTTNYMKLADSVAACVQEIISTNAPVQETMQRYQDEYNARYAGE